MHSNDIPKALPKARESVKIELVKEFFEECEKVLPDYMATLALVAFGGLRMSEALKMKKEKINFDEKEITISSKTSKTGARIGISYMQSNLPPNLWQWLEKYELPASPQNFYFEIGIVKSWAKLPDNALRHCFATYHLSLYRNANETALLMRHESARKLWGTYLDGLVSKNIAQKYFEISPQKNQILQVQ